VACQRAPARVEEEDVEREAHAERMHGPAVLDQQPRTGFGALQPGEAEQARSPRLGDGDGQPEDPGAGQAAETSVEPGLGVAHAFENPGPPTGAPGVAPVPRQRSTRWAARAKRPHVI
jgi:hypothetical protein